MKAPAPNAPAADRSKAFALVMVLVFAAISMIALGGMMTWATQSGRVTARNIAYFNAAAAAEAATEKVMASLEQDYQTQGAGLVTANLNTYRTLVPLTTEVSDWANYVFTDAQGNVGQTYVQPISGWVFTNLQSQYTGLNGLANLFRVVSNARLANSPYPVVAGVKQDVQLATIDIFQFAIFYSVELEINPGPAMTVNGRVHSNTNLYTKPGATLTFSSDVTAVGQIYLNRDPNDGQAAGGGTASFQGRHDSKVASLFLPIGTNNSPAAVLPVIGIPPASESPTSLMGQQRYYNKADMIILVSNTTVTAMSGAFNNNGISIPWNQVSNFVSTNVSFYNGREGKTIKGSQIDVGALSTWSATNTALRPYLPGGSRDVNCIYLADLRTMASGSEVGVRVVNGQTLPSMGLTIASQDPLYVQGHFNAPAAYLGTTNTTTTKPASLVADAITILSSAWSDSQNTSANMKTAGATTVNAAFLAGNVPTGIYSGVKKYSGGVENFPRFLENWSGVTFTYNGSMVVMFNSQFATGYWNGTGGYYNPPNRNWAFDLNFLNSAKLPPGTPQVRTLIRGSWAMVAPNSVN